VSYSSGPQDFQLSDYTGVLRRRWWLIVVVAVLGTVCGVGYLKVAHKVYTATASVYVTASSGTANQVANGRTTGTVNLDTEAQVVQSVAVAQAAGKLMHATVTPQKLISRISVTVPANSQVLSIGCQGSSAVIAANCAQSFLNYSSTSTTAAVNSQISVLQARIKTLQSGAAKLAIEITALPSNSPQRATDQQQLNSDDSQLGSLNSQVAQLTSDLADPSGGSIISNANPPQSATSPKPSLILPSGLLAGLLVGLILAYILDRRDRRIRAPRDLAKLNVPVLMSLPLRRFTPELAIATARSRVGRDFSELAHLLTSSLGSGRHVILVAGVSAGQGTSLAAANLAVALSRNQPDVMLVCADLEGSVIPAMAGLPSGPGLTDVLAGTVSAEEAERRMTTAPRLRVITPGSAVADAEDLRQDAVERLLNGLRSEARWVVVESPPVASGPDVYTLAHIADAAVLIAEVPRTRSNQVLDSVEHLDKMGTTVLGAVLLPSPAPSGNRTPPAPPAAAAPSASPAPAAVAPVSDWSAAEEASTSLHGS
jgi:capsular polysaccharide biosynthesis protein